MQNVLVPLLPLLQNLLQLNIVLPEIRSGHNVFVSISVSIMDCRAACLALFLKRKRL